MKRQQEQTFVITMLLMQAHTDTINHSLCVHVCVQAMCGPRMILGEESSRQDQRQRMEGWIGVGHRD